MTLPFFCVTCNHLRSDHAEGVGKCEFKDEHGIECTCLKFVSPFLGDENMAKATAAQTNDLKTKYGCTDAQLASLQAAVSAVPGFSWTALVALLEQFATSGLTLQSILALFGIV